MRSWFKQKTTKIGLAGILVAVAGAMTGELSITQAAATAFTSLIGLLAGDYDGKNTPQ